MSTNPTKEGRTPASERKRNDDKDDGDRGLMPLWRLSSVGIEMGVAVIVGWVMGHYLDKWLGTDPVLMIVFSVLGIAAGFKGMIAAAREAEADRRRKSALTDANDEKPPAKEGR